MVAFDPILQFFLHVNFCSLSSKLLFCCRYHYNVADTRLRQHVEKGNEDGLFISCVASASNLWALIMDAGTGFTHQVYDMSAVFLHKVTCKTTSHPSSASITFELKYWLCLVSHQDWIMEQWEKNYYISSIAGSTNGSSLVVMSKGKSLFALTK